ncbi:MAG: PIN domain-containing protein [Deltaproteobacteria bacterium]|nr:PIN domain-containing protein [Deltaproteobacteria bacterium]
MLERLLDSVILIDHFNGLTPATRFLIALNPDSTAISVITLAEILVGLDKEATGRVRPFLEQFRILSIDPPAAEKAADLRKRFGWKLPDAFQAALALQHHLRLVTRNTKDFDPRKHAFVEVPYKVSP